MNSEANKDADSARQFTVIRTLGEGGFGTVVEAYDARLCRSVALKQLRGAGIDRDALMREARLAASLQHPAFVKIFALDDAGDIPSIVMELVPGVTLREYCAQQAPTRAFMLATLDQVAEAMAEAHAAGLVHGDLKPGNLMIEPGGRVRILDFGLARQVDPLTTQASAIGSEQGTIAFMAPERLLGKAPDAAGDVYALGVVLYGMLAGGLPFKHLRGLALAAAHLQSGTDAWPKPAGADPALVTLMLRMTAREPARRIAGMAALRTELCIDAGHLPVAARMRLPRRWRAGAALLGAGSLALAAWFLVPDGTLAALRAPAYTESAALQSGLEGLRMFDRPGSLDSAMAQFGQVLQHHPRSAPALAGLALAYSIRYAGDGRDEAWLKKAEASAQAAQRLDDKLALSWVALAAVREYQDRLPEALVAIERARDLDPHGPFMLAGQARLLVVMRRFPAAEAVLLAAAAQHPRERRFADLLGTLRFQQGDYGAAEQAFRHSMQLEPDAVYAYANLSATLLRLNRADEALRVLQQGLQIRPAAVLYGNLGATLFARGDYPGAADAFERAVADRGGNPNYYLNWANLGDALRWLPGREADAQRAYLRATQLLAPRAADARHNAALLSRLGLYYARLDEPAQAQAWTARALAEAPKNADVRFRAAMASEMAGRRQEAIDHLLAARALKYPANLIESEPDFIALRRDPRYQDATTKELQ
jgi:tetratricopeptide (TPR) repeat protein